MNSYIWEEYKQLGKGKYQTVKISLLHGRIKTEDYNNVIQPKVRIEIVNANGERDRKIIVLGEKEIAQILGFMNNSKEKELSLIHKFNDKTKSIYITKYIKNGKAYYIVRIAEGKNNSVSFSFVPYLFRYLMEKIKNMITLMSFQMNWEYSKKNNKTNNNVDLPDIDNTELEENFDEETPPDELPDDIDF